jgi:hypothetical protein
LACSLGGVFLGGTIVAIFMVFSLAGGVLCLIASNQQRSPSNPLADEPSLNLHQAQLPLFATDPSAPLPLTSTPVIQQSLEIRSRPPEQSQGSVYGGLTLVGLILAVVIVATFFIPGQFSKLVYEKSDPLTELAKIQPANIDSNGELAKMFQLMSDYTDLQRTNKLSELTGQTVAWTLPVFDVSKDGDSYRVQTGGLTNAHVGTFVSVSVRNSQERQFIEGLKTGDVIPFKGTIQGSLMRNLLIKPAILTNGLYTVVTKDKNPPAITTVTESSTSITKSEQVPPVVPSQSNSNQSKIMGYVGGQPDDEFFALPEIKSALDSLGWERDDVRGNLDVQLASPDVIMVSWTPSAAIYCESSIIAINIKTGHARIAAHEKSGVLTRGASDSDLTNNLMQTWILKHENEPKYDGDPNDKSR